MKIRISNPNIDNNESSFLTLAAAVGATTLTVKNSNGFAANDYIVIGKMGTEGAEIRQISSVASDTSVVIDALDFAHSVNTPITFIDFNQIYLYSSTSKTGTYTQVGTANTIEADQIFTEIEDSSGSSSTWYKIRFYNSTSVVWSDYSDPVQGTGYVGRALRTVLDKIYILAHDDNRRIISEDDMISFLNDAYNKAINKLMKADHFRFVKKGYVSIKNSYNTGSISITNGSTTVTGTDTVFSVSWTNKKLLVTGEGFTYDIASVESPTSLTLTQAYDGAGADLSASGYTIFQDEYDIYDSATNAEVTDLRRIEEVVDEDGNRVDEYGVHRSETGWYLKRDGENLKFCLNYIPSTTGAEGKWEVSYLYQPTTLDSMADEPEFPYGYDDLLVPFGVARIKERIGELKEAAYYDSKFEMGMNKLVHGEERRGPQLKGFRLDRGISSTEHDNDWINDVYSRKIVD